MTPQNQITNCKTIDELRNLWQSKVDDWKTRRDFKAIVAAKDKMKFRFTWTADLNALMDKYDSNQTDETLPEIQSIVETVLSDIPSFPIDYEGLMALKKYIRFTKEGNTTFKENK